METQTGSYLPRLIGGIAAILLGTSGIAAMVVWAPGAIQAPADAFTDDSRPAEGGTRLPAKCEECGVVVSTREFAPASEEVEPGASGEATRSARNAAPRSATTGREITVRMRDGSRRVFRDAKPANWHPGERVILIGNAERSGQ